MALLYLTPEGKKVAKATGTADNTAGGAAASIDVALTFSELEHVLDVLAIIVYGSGAFIETYSIAGNTVTVRVNVPAGAAATVEVVALGY